MKQSLNLGAIGNCSVAALVGQTGSIEWFCYPQFDADPVLARLVNGPEEAGRPGYFDIRIEGFTQARQHYEDNSPILVTLQENAQGDEIEITDFCPIPPEAAADPLKLPKRILRLVRATKGKPRVIVTLRPVADYGAREAQVSIADAGTIGYTDGATVLTLRTNAPAAKVAAAEAVDVDKLLFFSFGEDAGVLGAAACEKSLAGTRAWWAKWISSLRLPQYRRAEVIRAAISLKICTHLPTGGMVAALTSSIPEFDNCRHRHWDYRYSWARDNFFTVNALTALGDRQALHVYARWLHKILTYCREHNSYPAAFRIAGTHDAEEHINQTLSGYRGQGTVRVGNEAYKQQQNDFFASVILSLLPFFTDQRFKPEDCPVPISWLEDLATVAVRRYDRADAGLWELRTQERIYTYSAVNCWSACHCLELIFAAAKDDAKAAFWHAEAEKLKNDIIKRGWNEKHNSFTNAFQSDDADASLFLIGELGFLDARDPRYAQTVQFLETRLRKGVFVFRYDHADDFGPGCVNAFVPCSLWMIHALGDLPARRDEAKKLFDELLALRNAHGMLSEHIDPKTGELWANYPQTFSMAGIVTAALKLS